MVACLPSQLKRHAYRFCFGYQIGRGVRIGFSLIDARACIIGDGVSIGHLNVVTGVRSFQVGEQAHIGHLNIFRGGDEVHLGRYAEVMRLNEINSIPNPRVTNPVDPRFHLGDAAVVTTGHKIDFTDRVVIGRHSVVAGRNSSIWTHNRQQTSPVEVGESSYVGSEIRIAPGGCIPSRCIVGIGSVITRRLEDEGSFIAGVPARVIRPLEERDQPLLDWRARVDLPEDL